jgi:hypothetical protein
LPAITVCGMGRWSELWRSWGPAVLTPVGVIIAAVSQAIYTSEKPADRHLPWLIVSICGAVLAGATPPIDARIRQKKRRDVATKVKRAREEEVVSINDALDPLVETLAQLAMKPAAGRTAAAAKLLTQALNSASQVIGPDRIRVSYFEAVGGKSQDDPYRLICTLSAGRHTKPTTVFQQGHVDGDWVISLLQHDTPYFCANVKTDPPPGWDAAKPRSYETFISVPASAEKVAVGMLTADAESEGDLQEQDIPLLRVIGRIIAISVRLVEDGK